MRLAIKGILFFWIFRNSERLSFPGTILGNDIFNDLMFSPKLILKNPISYYWTIYLFTLVLVLKGCLVTIDAMGCQQAIAEKIIQQEGDYILAVKDNQKCLHQDIQEAFEHAAIEDYYSQTELAHGRIETRTTSLITDMDWICSREQWAGLACIIRVEATREQKKSGLTENSTRYYISSKTATAQYFQASIRSHWAIENKLHWMLDVAFGEDNSKKRKNNSAQNFSLISKIALHMIQKHPQDPARGAKKISVKRKIAA